MIKTPLVVGRETSFLLRFQVLVANGILIMKNPRDEKRKN